MNTENNTQDTQDDGILSFEDAITSQDSEKQPEVKTEESSGEQAAEAAETNTPSEQPSETTDDQKTDQLLEPNDDVQADDDENVVTFESFGFCPEIMQA